MSTTIGELLKSAQAEAESKAEQERIVKWNAEMGRFAIAQGHLVRRMKTVLGVKVDPTQVHWAGKADHDPEIAYVDLEGMRFAAQVIGPFERYDSRDKERDEKILLGMLVCEQGHYRFRYYQDSDHELIGRGYYGKTVAEELLAYKKELDESRASCKKCEKAGRISTLQQELYAELGLGSQSVSGAPGRKAISALLKHVYADNRAKALREAVDAVGRNW